ncbi:hypothetical protein HYPSUDRAFT_1030351 [Hypholoma sublateritium FD-334 SS-4]|uniref:Uncharacterized protein n=1 Tax=Hypholoma sublateritium (strain FD-334 SS-4) TaxID=945553 RepID=A0A0D2LGM0_HYPSF|nr:hypothetical protein HYPSUDRAFT_1030351 [Hypholoma sublateritium FD-334 SS-4]
MSTLQSKTIVVVGGSSGIGFAVALAALQSLARVVIIATSSSERVSNAVERLRSRKLPGEVRGEVLDATDAVAVKEFALRIGVVDHIAWTSGDVSPGLVDGDLSKLDTSAAFAVRFWGPFILAQNVKFHPGGSLTLTSGILDIKPLPGRSVPAGVVAGIEGLTKGLAVDLAPVRVNLVGPGAIKTELWDKFPPAALEKMLEDLHKARLLQRIGRTDEIAEAYIFLMKCGYITGQRINVDGGVF